MRRGDGCHVGPVVTADRYNRKQVSALVHLDPEGGIGHRSEGGVLAGYPERSQYPFVAQVAVLVRIDHDPPLFPIVPDQTVVQGDGLVGRAGVLESLEGLSPGEEVAFRAGPVLGGARLGGTASGGVRAPVAGRLAARGGRRAFPGAEIREPLEYGGGEQFRGGFEAEAEFTLRVHEALGQRQAAAREALEPAVRLRAAKRAGDDIARAGGIEDVHQLPFPGRGDGEARGRGVDPGVEDRDDHAPAVRRRQGAEEGIGGDLALGDQGGAQRGEVGGFRLRGGGGGEADGEAEERGEQEAGEHRGNRGWVQELRSRMLPKRGSKSRWCVWTIIPSVSPASQSQIRRALPASVCSAARRRPTCGGRRRMTRAPGVT